MNRSPIVSAPRLLSLLASVVLVALVPGCRRSDVEPSSPPTLDADAEAGANARVDAAVTEADPLALHPVPLDLRLSAARLALRKRDPRAAAVAAGDAATKPGLSPRDACAFSHYAGRLSLSAGDAPAALAHFTRAADGACPLAPYAKLGAARSRVALRAFAEAVPLAEAAVDTAAGEEARMVQADALASSGRRAESIPLWRKVLATAPRGAHWIEAAGRLSSALADGAEGKADEAREAYDLATRVLLEAPGRADLYGAMATRTRSAAIAKLPVALSQDERLAHVRGLLDTGDATRALAESNTLFADPTASPKVACGAAIVRAQATAKTAKSAAQADAWGDTFAKCDADPELVTALYSGAKASVSAKRPQEALFRFGEVERRFPEHRFADDAAVRAALVLEEQGDRPQSLDKLSKVADLYPGGDMRGEALFRAALVSLKAGNDAAAMPLLERIDQLLPDDRHWATAGRATFFRARILERKGDAKGASSLDEEILERAPLSYYMGRSYAKLAEKDAARAQSTLERLAERDKSASFPKPSHDVLQSTSFRRGVALLEVGDVEAAKREMVSAHALGEGAPAELIWAASELFDRAEAWEVGHAPSRGKVSDHLAHYPEGPFRSLWQTAYPRAFAEEVEKASATHAFPMPFVWGIMREESSFMAEVRSPANAYGLMQLLPSTAKWISGGAISSEGDLKKPEISVDLGTKLLAQLFAQHKHPALGAAAYNAGSGAVSRWMGSRPNDDLELFVEVIPYEETRNYVKRVLGTSNVYAYLYDRPKLESVLRLSSKVSP